MNGNYLEASNWRVVGSVTQLKMQQPVLYFQRISDAKRLQALDVYSVLKSLYWKKQ